MLSSGRRTWYTLWTRPREILRVGHTGEGPCLRVKDSVTTGATSCDSRCYDKEHPLTLQGKIRGEVRTKTGTLIFPLDTRES